MNNIYLNNFNKKGISWKAKILSPITEEKRFAADFLGVLNLNLPGYLIEKYFFAQAKRQNRGERLSTSEWDRLRTQCRTMLELKAESFVFVYAKSGIVVVPAVNVIACSGPRDLHTLNPHTIKSFYLDHFQCWIGATPSHSFEHAILQNSDDPPVQGVLIIGEAADNAG